MRQKTIAELIRDRLAEMGYPKRGVQAEAIRQIAQLMPTPMLAIKFKDQIFSPWFDTEVESEPNGEHLDALAKWLGLESAYDLGPALVATKLERARRRGLLPGKRR